MARPEPAGEGFGQATPRFIGQFSENQPILPVWLGFRGQVQGENLD
jgi:hypothetical protein